MVFLPYKITMERAEIEKKIVNCIGKIMKETGKVFNEYDWMSSVNLSLDLQFSSLEYVKLIVYLEIEFEIEFQDSILDFGAFEEFEALVDYVVFEVKRSDEF